MSNRVGAAPERSDRQLAAAEGEAKQTAAPRMISRRHTSGQLKSFAALSSSLLPAFGAGLDGSHPELKRFVIAPFDPRYRLWQMFLMVLVFYSAWASPFELAFQQVGSGSLLVFDLVVDVFFGIDIVVSFFVAYFNPSTYLLVDDRRKIAKRYLRSPGLVMDVASTVPFQIIYRILTGKRNGGSVFGVVSLLRLWRLRRASKLFARHQVPLLLDKMCQARLCDTICSAFSGLCLLLDGNSLPRQGTHMDRKHSAQLRRSEHLVGLHLRHVLVHHHPHHRRLRRPPRLEHRREDLHYLPHALQHRPHRLPHRKHDQSHRPRRHPHFPHARHHTQSFAICEQAPAAGGNEGADDGAPAAQVQDDGAATGRSDRGPAQGHPIHHRAVPLPTHSRRHVPLQRSLQRVHDSAGFGDASRVLPPQIGHHHRERDPDGLLHHRLWRCGRLDVEERHRKVSDDARPCRRARRDRGHLQHSAAVHGSEQEALPSRSDQPSALHADRAALQRRRDDGLFQLRSVPQGTQQRLSRRGAIRAGGAEPSDRRRTLRRTRTNRYWFGRRYIFLSVGTSSQKLNCFDHAGGQPEAYTPTSSTELAKRVTIHGYRPGSTKKEETSITGKLVFLPDSMEELLSLAESSFGMRRSKVFSADGAEIDEICTIRDDDHLFIC